MGASALGRPCWVTGERRRGRGRGEKSRRRMRTRMSRWAISIDIRRYRGFRYPLISIDRVDSYTFVYL